LGEKGSGTGEDRHSDTPLSRTGWKDFLQVGLVGIWYTDLGGLGWGEGRLDFDMVRLVGEGRFVGGFLCIEFYLRLID